MLKSCTKYCFVYSCVVAAVRERIHNYSKYFTKITALSFDNFRCYKILKYDFRGSSELGQDQFSKTINIFFCFRGMTVIELCLNEKTILKVNSRSPVFSWICWHDCRFALEFIYLIKSLSLLTCLQILHICKPTSISASHCWYCLILFVSKKL